MDKQTAIEIVNTLNNEYVPIVNKVMKNRLGVDTKMKAIIKEGRNEFYYYLVNEDKTDVDKKMRGNKILRHLFNEVNLQINVWVFDNEFGFDTNIYYKHCNGGSNGHDLLLFYINRETKKVRFLKNR